MLSRVVRQNPLFHGSWWTSIDPKIDMSLKYLRPKTAREMNPRDRKNEHKRQENLAYMPICSKNFSEHSTEVPSAAVVEEFMMNITTFNILAPCYKRIGFKTKDGCLNPASRESHFLSLCSERAKKLCDFISADLHRSDVICLQEYWFEPAFQEIFSRTLGSHYIFYGAQRTGQKSDGLALLLKKDKFVVNGSRVCRLSEVGNRIAVLLQLQVSPASPPFLVLNTHLTFPHTAFDRKIQFIQMRNILRLAEEYSSEMQLPINTPKIILGDFNVEEDDPVFKYLKDRGFRSTRAGTHKYITHHNHRERPVSVDHIFISSPDFHEEKSNQALVATDSSGVSGLERFAASRETQQSRNSLLGSRTYNVDSLSSVVNPAHLDSTCWPTCFEISDHRPYSARLKFSVNKV